MEKVTVQQKVTIISQKKHVGSQAIGKVKMKLRLHLAGGLQGNFQLICRLRVWRLWYFSSIASQT